MRGHREKAAICKPRREASEGTKPANTLILHLQHPEPQDNVFVLLKPPGFWLSFFAALVGLPSHLISQRSLSVKMERTTHTFQD